MAGTPPAGRRPSGSGRDRLPHHISNIAHLFFDESTEGTVPGPGAPVELAVAGLGAGQASAFVCAGLVAGTSQRQGRRWRWELCEADDVTWSAAAYAPAPGGEPQRESGYPRAAAPGSEPAPEPTGPLVRWSHLGDLVGSDLEALERWRGIRAPAGRERRAGRPGSQGLVVALAEHEAGRWSTALLLGRLLGAVVPARLEVLVFPSTWVHGGAGRRDSGTDIEPWCRALTSALCGACPLTVTTGLPAPEAGAKAGPILARIASRLLGDFEVDPSS